jgi:hypothetical protein
MRVILLEQPKDDPTSYHYLLWADVPLERQRYYAAMVAVPTDIPLFVSQWLDATAADNQALQDGSVVEQRGTMRPPPGTTLPQIENFLVQRWNDYQSYISNFNPWIHYGTTWDGTIWTTVTGG